MRPNTLRAVPTMVDQVASDSTKECMGVAAGRPLNRDGSLPKNLKMLRMETRGCCPAEQPPKVFKQGHWESGAN